MQCSIRLTVAALFLIPCLASGVQPFKCTVSGRVVYQQVPCDGGSKVDTSGAGHGDRSSRAAMQAQQEVLEVQRKEQIDRAVLSRKIFIGMLAEDVVRSWGRPSKINKTLTVSGLEEQWVYLGGKGGQRMHVYVADGVVQAVQQLDSSP
jgi:hypothetical protein